MHDSTILCPEFVLRGHDSEPETGVAALVIGSKIACVDTISKVIQKSPNARRIDLPRSLLMPGLVNAHQHGRGVSQIQLGYPDQRLELWMAQRRARGCPDLRAIGLLAAMEMIRNGVTCAVHADLTYGSGDYEAEVRACVAAYDAAGLRATIAIGVCDQGTIVFPQQQESVFLAGLPADTRRFLEARRAPPYAKNWEATSKLMDRLAAEWADIDRINFCYGPSGPQWVTDDLFRAVALDARQRGVGLHIHALETVAQYEACRRLFPEGTMRHLERLGALGSFTTIAHGVFLTDDDINVLADSHALVATNPGSNLRLCDGTARVYDLLHRGVRVAIGSDNTSLMDDEDLFSEARVAARLVGRRNWATPELPTGRQVIEMLTVNGAAVAGCDGQVGRLEAGWAADITAMSLDRTRGAYLDQDTSLVDAVVARARGADVRLTMVGGKVLYLDGKFSHLDTATIQAEARNAALSARLPANLDDVALTAALRPHLARYYKALTVDTRFPDVLS